MTVKVQKSVRRTTVSDIVAEVAAVARKLKHGQSFFVTDLDWSDYSALLEELQDRHPRITFDNGRLEIMPNSCLHEAIGWLINTLLTIWADELDLSFCARGQLTFARKDLAKGLVPDHCYWLANAARVERKKRIDFRRDPPPDLVIEVEVSRTVISRLEIYAALKVPEVWRCTSDSIEVGLLQPDGKYAWGEESEALPGIPLKQIVRCLRLLEKRTQLTLMRQFRNWVREHREAN